MSVSQSQATGSLLLAHLNLDVRDLARSIEFYGAALELPVEVGENTVTVRWPSFLLVLSAGTPGASDNFHFGFRVETSAEVDAWMSRLRARGCPIVEEPERRGTVYIARTRDPDGYVVEVFAFV